MNSLKILHLKGRAKNELLYAIIPFILTWSFDRLSKIWAENLEQSFDVLIFKFNLVYNNGIMMGWLAQLPDHTKITIIGTLGAVILSSYILILAVAPIQSNYLRIGLSLLAGGIIGNVTDRLIGSAVVDFIGLALKDGHSPFYNLADIFQWFGYALIGFGIYQDSIHWWPSQDFRNRTLIKPSFQLRIGLLLGMTNFLVGFIFIIFGFAFFKEETNSAFINHYFISAAILLFFLTLAGIVIGMILSHRVAGPVYALEKYFNETLDGIDRPFKLRKNDEFKELEEICTRINSKINKKD